MLFVTLILTLQKLRMTCIINTNVIHIALRHIQQRLVQEFVFAITKYRTQLYQV
jgi:hypothetical protein